MSHHADPPPLPLIVAHRAANDLDTLRAAQATGVDLIEADLWLWRGRLEVRHSKTMGPVPLLWDRWSLERGWTPRLTLDQVVRATAPGTELMLDLKGTATAIPRRVIEAMDGLAPGRRYTVASQSWDLLEPFRDLPHVRVVHSIGNDRMFRALPGRLADRPAEAIGINYRLLTRERAEALRDLAPLLFSWTVNERSLMDRLVDWGVNGIISDAYDALRPVQRAPETPDRTREAATGRASAGGSPNAAAGS